MVQIFGASDYETLDYASKAAGEYEVSRVTASVTTNSSEGESSGSELDRVGPAFGRTFLQSTVMAGVRLALDDTKRSNNTATSESQSVGLHVVPLLRPDEIALQFAREAGASLLLIKGQRPMWVLRVNYNESLWFAGTFTPLAKWWDQARKGARPSPFWQRSGEGFRQVAAAFNDLASGGPSTPTRNTQGAR
jgi:type IV secretory pathway TraG/TraD family ATPase VirD4